MWITIPPEASDRIELSDTLTDGYSITVVLANVKHPVVIEDEVLSLDAGEATLNLRKFVKANALYLLRVLIDGAVDRADGVIGVDKLLQIVIQRARQRSFRFAEVGIDHFIL